MVLAEALGRCPHAIVVRPHMQLYIDVSARIMSIAQRFTDLVKVYLIDELFIEPSGVSHPCFHPQQFIYEIEDKILLIIQSMLFPSTMTTPRDNKTLIICPGISSILLAFNFYLYI
jgi:nucleotidyltransferase/DNA polymerase involved in DNA repair